jgi:hypothetical protein
MRRLVLSIAVAALCLTPMAVTTVQGAAQQILVVNQAQSAIHELYISPDFHGRWGGNRLLGRALAPGESTAVTLPGRAGTCFFDIQLVTDTGVRQAIWGQQLCDRQALTLGAP